MKKLFKVSCSGNMPSQIYTRDDIYVVAQSFEEAGQKALQKMKELNYNKIDEYVSNIEMVADEQESNKHLLIV